MDVGLEVGKGSFMFNLRSGDTPIEDVVSDDNLRQQVEYDIKKDEESEVSLEVAQKLLKVKSIDKEYRKLQTKALETQFKFDETKTSHGLRPYQIQTLNRLEDLFAKGTMTAAVQLPTGAGKTFVIHSFVYKNVLKKSKNALIITPSWEIANQHAATVCQQFKDGTKRVRRLGGNNQLISAFGEYSTKDKGKAIITTSALFYARHNKLKESLKVDYIVIDEGHHGWNKKRLNTIQAFATEHGAKVIYLTATPPMNMARLPFASQLSYLDLVPEYLVPCEIQRLNTGETFNPVLRNGILTQSSRVEISTRSSRYEKIVRDSIPLMKGQTIYYAGSVKEAMGVVEEYAKHEIDAVVVHSKWVKKCDQINALAIERFRSGKAQVLVNVQMLAMGFDVPRVETIIVARPVESDTLFTQMVGRGARPRPNKDKFILIDVHDTVSKPEVAKIFEHKHLFYSGAVEEPTKELPPMPASEVRVISLPLRPKGLDIAVPTIDDVTRSRVIVPFFLSAYMPNAA